MTNTELENENTGLTTVDHKDDKSAVVSSKRHTSKFLINLDRDGTAYWRIDWDTSAVVPKELRGKFSRIDYAIKAIQDYVATCKPSASKLAERESLVPEFRAKRNEHLRKGADH